MTTQEREARDLAAALQNDAAINPQFTQNAFNTAVEEAKRDGYEFV